MAIQVGDVLNVIAANPMVERGPAEVLAIHDTPAGDMLHVVFREWCRQCWMPASAAHVLSHGTTGELLPPEMFDVE